MTLSMYDASVGALIHSMEALSAVLAKGAAHAEAKKIEPAVFINARLAPDMFPLSRQVQVASDMARGGGARLAGMEPPSWPDTETTFAELQARLAKTVEFLRGLDKAKIEESAGRSVVLKLRTMELKFTGSQYLLRFVLPNFYFHVTTAYDILRHNGVEIGKRDYLGPLT